MCHNRLRRAFRQHQKSHDTGRIQKKPPRVDGDCLARCAAARFFRISAQLRTRKSLTPLATIDSAIRSWNGLPTSLTPTRSSAYDGNEYSPDMVVAEPLCLNF